MWSVCSDSLCFNGEPVEQIKSPNCAGKFSSHPKIAVIHFTAGASARSTAEWFCHTENSESSAHLIIERDGTVIQCVGLDRIAWHAGKSRWGDLIGLNAYSIGIELANWGDLRPSGSGWMTFGGKQIADPYIGIHRNGNPDGSRSAIGWEAFPEVQIRVAKGVVRALVDAYGISEIVGHDDIAPTRKWDPGPAFDMVRFRASVLDLRKDDGDNVAIVSASTGLNLREGPDTTHAILTTLKNGSQLELLSKDGAWVEVTALDGGGMPWLTGWVHGHYVKI